MEFGAMSKPDNFHGSSAAIFGFAFAVFAVLMVLAHSFAALEQRLNPNLDSFYDLVVFTIWACILLLTPALCFHVFSRSDASNNYWRAFWTFGYLALLVHLYWAIAGSCGGSIDAIYNLDDARKLHSGCIVEHPSPDFFLAGWWGLDVILAWVLSDNIKWVRVQRGAVHLLAFAMFFGAFVLADKAGISARLLGILMAIIVVTCFVIRLVISDNDPKSLLMVLYVKFFRFLNLLVIWHKLPTFLAVANLGALREVLRAKNLHNTSDIPVTVRGSSRPMVPPLA